MLFVMTQLIQATRLLVQKFVSTNNKENITPHHLLFKGIDCMMTSSNGNSFRVSICAGNSPVPGEFPAQRPVTRSFDVFFDLSLNKRLSKQSWGWWFETLSCPLWRHCNGYRRKRFMSWSHHGLGNIKWIMWLTPINEPVVNIETLNMQV